MNRRELHLPTILAECRQALSYFMLEIMGEAGYRRRLRAQGIDLSSESLTRLGLDRSKAHNHANSGGPHLERVFRELGVAPQASILDLGCGKGGALLTMAQFPFRRIAGLDLSEEMLRIARRNLAIAGLSHVELIHADAATFEDYDDFDHIYLYNPFPAPVLRAVMNNLSDSLRRAPRRLTLIYKNPRFHDEVIRSGEFAMVSCFTHAGHPIHVYTGGTETPQRDAKTES